ncbi:MAG: NADH-quinone oxidoreductase subunit J [Candidatus Dadabacteria bacterium]|nr:MAG: NADH-quinone oxidoreductase subunit J [Candidatus Dadabacteria bacterium]
MSLIFYILAGFLIATALAVVFVRDAVYSALWLVGNLFGVACVFAMLGAHFLAVSQIIVYAGAIMVLVLFVIMLLNEKVERQKRDEYLLAAAAIGGVGLFLTPILALSSFFRMDLRFLELVPVGTVKSIGQLLFTRYLFPFEAASVLLLAAIVLAVMLARRRKKERVKEQNI